MGGRDLVRLIFQVADLDETRRGLVGQGVEVTEPTESDEGYREIRLRDPEGTPIHLFSWVVGCQS